MPDTRPTAVEVPSDVFADLVEVARHVSLGRGAAGVVGPYSDAVARRALGALDDAGLLPPPAVEPPAPPRDLRPRTCARCEEIADLA